MPLSHGEYVGPTGFDGYFDHDNKDVFSADGYFRTGDLVELCGENSDFYRIVGRCKDITNRGGMKISPAELDMALEEHPDIVEAAVCPYPDERLGEKICACLVMKPGVALMTMATLQDYLSEVGLAKFKFPGRQTCRAIGSSSKVVVEEWHGRARARPAKHLEEAAIILRGLLDGEKARFEGELAKCNGYRLRTEAPGAHITVAAFGPAAAMPAELTAAVGLVGNKEAVRNRMEQYRSAGADEICIVPATAGDSGGERTLSAVSQL